MGLAHGVGKVQQNVHRVAKGRRLKDLRADVAVEPLHLQMGPGQGVRHKLGRLAGLNGNPELAVDPSGVDGLEGVGVNPGGYPQQDPLPVTPGAGGLLQALQLLVIVHDEAPHPAVQGIRNVLIGLVVPVEIEFLRGKSPRQGRVNLPGGDHIRPHALFFQHRVEALEAEGLSGKQGQGAPRHPFRHRLAVGPAVGPDLVLIQHIQRGAKLLRQGHRIQAAHCQMSLVVDPQVVI